MPKHYKWEGTKLIYNIPGAGDASLDIATLPQAVKDAGLMFGLQTAARNATAGFFEKEPETALKRMSGRFKTWLEGVWKAAGAGGEGESRTSMLAQAVAEAGGISVDDAADLITNVITEKVEEAGLGADEDSDKAAIRKIGAAVRASFAGMPEVQGPLARLRREAAEAREKTAIEAVAKAKAEGKIGTLAELLKG